MFFAVACGEKAPLPSVLIVSIDTLRADVVGAWGATPSVTPHLDALASKGTRFSAATTVTPLTLPAHTSLFTGLRPTDHHLSVNGLVSDGFAVPTLAERLSSKGWVTGAFISAPVLDRQHGLVAGFGHYDDDLFEPGGPLQAGERRGDQTVERALEWIRDQQSSWFTWVHLFDPHAPYDAPGGVKGLGREAYLDEVAFADAQLGRLVDEVASTIDSPVLVVVLSDHGEGLGDHGEETHGLLLHEATVHIPLVFAWIGEGSGFPHEGETRHDPVSIMDVGATVLDILDLSGWEYGAGVWGGQSVLKPAGERPLPLENRAPLFYYGFSPLVGVRRGEEKVVGAVRSEPPSWMLTLLTGDEISRVVDDHPLVGLMPSIDAPWDAQVGDDMDALSALGYLGGDLRSPQAGSLPDPRDQMALMVALDRAVMEMAEGRAGEARRRLMALRREEGDLPELLLLLGRSCRLTGRFGEALETLESAIDLHPTFGIYREMGRTWMGLSEDENSRRFLSLDREEGRRVVLERAAESYDRALELRPGDALAISERALVDLLSGEIESCRIRLEQGLQKRPQSVTLLTVLWRLVNSHGSDRERVEVRNRLKSLAPNHPLLK